MMAGLLERRRARRYAAHEDHGIVFARVRPGCDVDVVDASAGGALVEGRRRLLPGAPVELHLQCVGRPAEIVRGLIIRCSVARLREDAIWYQVAIAFERRLWWFPHEGPIGYSVLGAERSGPPVSGQMLPAMRRR